MERFERAVVKSDRRVGLKNKNVCSCEGKALGHVRGLSSHYANGVERMEIHVMKKAAHALPYKNTRIRITLVIRDELYTGGLRSTERNKYVWICPDLILGGVKKRLADVLNKAKFRKNCPVQLIVRGDHIHVALRD